MTWRQRYCFACATLIVASSTIPLAIKADTMQGAGSAASRAAADSPALVGALSKEIGATPEQAAGTAGGLAAATSAFTKLGLKPELVTKAIPVLTSFVTKSGGANVGNLLAGVLK